MPMLATMDTGSTPWLPLRSTDDRSSTLRPDARSTGATTARSSFDHRPTVGRNSSTLSHLKQRSPPTRSLTALSTPHDRVLEKMYNHPGKSESVLHVSTAAEPHQSSLDRDISQTGGLHHRTASEANMYQIQGTVPHSLNEPANAREGAGSPAPTASLASNTFPATRLYDPFDGSPLGIVTLAEPPVRSRETMPVIDTNGSNEDVWAHLSRVLDLQHQIARMHVDMEGLGPGKQTDNKGKGPLNGSFARQRTTSTGSMPGADIGDEEGIGVVDEEAEKLQVREREFKKLATQFEGRKEAINNMMNKLDDLSKALSEFHSLQGPRIEFLSSSRNNSLGPTFSDQLQSPIVIPPSDSVSPISHGDSSFRSSAIRSSVPTPYSKAPDDITPATNISFPSASVSQKTHAPFLLINSTEPSTVVHMVDSPASTVSLKLPQETANDGDSRYATRD